MILMRSRGRELLTPDQRLEFMKIPCDEWTLGTYYTFSNHDLSVINRHRRDDNRLGFAVQLSVLRYPGWSWTDIKELPDIVLQYIAQQINADPSALMLYPQRENTLWDHLKEIRQEYGYRNFSIQEYRTSYKFLLHQAAVNGDSIHLLRTCMDELRNNKVILPAITTIERVVWEARHKAEEKIFNKIHSSLSVEQKQRLDEIIEPIAEKKKTTLGWLKETFGYPSPDSFIKIVDRLEYIRNLKLEVDLEEIRPNRLIQLSRLGSRYEPYAFRDFKDNKRYAILAVFLINLCQDLIDQAFEIHNRQMLNLMSNGRKTQDSIQKQN
jgi:TnpA family transposase